MFGKSASGTETTGDSQERALISELVGKARQGDEQAFGNLYELYFEKIYKFVYFRVNHKQIAEDLAEDVFVRAWTKIQHVGESSFGGWIYSIAKNRVIDHYRQSKETINIIDVENILEADENLVDATNLLFDQKIFMNLLRQLAPEQQIVLKLKFIEDMENDEIAELISKSEGSIRVIQHRAIQKLQQLYDKQIISKLQHKNAEN